MTYENNMERPEQVQPEALDGRALDNRLQDFRSKPVRFRGYPNKLQPSRHGLEIACLQIADSFLQRKVCHSQKVADSLDRSKAVRAQLGRGRRHEAMAHRALRLRGRLDSPGAHRGLIVRGWLWLFESIHHLRCPMISRTSSLQKIGEISPFLLPIPPKGDKKRERGRRRGVKTRRFSDWLKEGRKEFPLSRGRIVSEKCQESSRFNRFISFNLFSST